MQGKVFALLALLLVVVIGVASSVYVVSEQERAVKLRFGEVVEADVPPGLHFKIPFVNHVRKFDGRLLTLNARPERFLTIEKKSLIVDSYAKWRVANVEKYYTATSGEELRAHALLAQRINAGLRDKFGALDMHEVVSGKRDELMQSLTESIDKVARKQFGIEVVDIRVKQVDLPTDVRQSVFDRMNTEREREAREYRSRGQELAEGIRAAADREKVEIGSEAYRDAEAIRGRGDAKAAQIYAQAYSKDADFYAFWRSLKAYEQAFASKSDLLLLKPDSDFFRFMNEKDGK
ncbi:Modulator of FtsH protease HflC [BD1-7 clade bacterium]|uniref:Protein HflC n=1 Tax=BD1-7 clade bacterium TaxID=2029982 RepID=A0A5S9MYP0_9GAMM|nr:Modulator of FtsH protease HflC [BD1-7 clade bacterium]CAA0082521.1 Modulator of FtsH protease HflC [BD1-7 clade bacterium]